MQDFLKNIFKNQSFDENNFFLLAGPCVVESEELVFEVAEKIRKKLPQFIEDILKDVKPSKSETTRCLNVDFFEF